MTTTTQPAIQMPTGTAMVDDQGMPTVAFTRFLSLLAYEVGKMKEAALTYDELDTGTATTAQIATSLNTFMTSIQET